MSGTALEIPCRHEHEGDCCMRMYVKKKGVCTILVDTDFPDNLCHFRKERLHGPNLYDHREVTTT